MSDIHRENLSPTVIDYHQKHSHRSSHKTRRFRSERSTCHQQLSNSWQIHQSSTGRIYYYNILTDQSQWEKPSSLIKNQSKHNHSKRISDDDFDSIPSNKKSILLSTPTSPPSNEKIQIDLVDPILLSPIDFHPKQTINENASLGPSQSTINAILELEHSSTNNDNITRYYRGELIEHLLNWPSTQIERETIRLSNQQIRFTTSQLTSLRTHLYSIRLKFHRNDFQLLKYRYILSYQNHLINILQSK